MVGPPELEMSTEDWLAVLDKLLKPTITEEELASKSQPALGL
jgi:hypothetical protein